MVGDEIIDDVVRSCAASMQDVAQKVAADVKDRVSKPVGYTIGPRGGTRKIRSKPGEPPRRDTGRLMSEITSSSVEVGDQIAGAVEVPTPYAEPLQESLDRPITDDVLEATEELMLDRLIDAVEAG